jgi:hypothetical protein
VASVGRSGVQRVRSSLAGVVKARVAREDEILRQMSDVFKELAHLSVDVGAVWQSVESLRAKVDAQTAMLSELLAVTTMVDAERQSTELLGRLLQSARARLDVLEAGQSSA